MSFTRALIQREIASREPFKVGTVVGAVRTQRFDGTGAGAGIMVVCDVEIGANRPLLNVPIKAGSDGSRFFAQDGAVVLLRRNAGRWQVIGPGDRAAAQKIVRSYDLGTQAQVGGDGLEGARRVVDSFEFYLGPTAMRGAPLITLTQAANDTITRSANTYPGAVAGSFVDDGFEVGEIVWIGRLATVAAGQPNRVVQTVTDTVLTLSGTAFSGSQGPIAGVTLGQGNSSRWNNGANHFPSIRTVDATGNPITPS